MFYAFFPLCTSNCIVEETDDNYVHVVFVKICLESVFEISGSTIAQGNRISAQVLIIGRY